MQKVISDSRQFDNLLCDLKSENYKINKSQEDFGFPGIFFIHKNGTQAYIEQLENDKIHLLERACQDCWK